MIGSKEREIPCFPKQKINETRLRCDKILILMYRSGRFFFTSWFSPVIICRKFFRDKKYRFWFSFLKETIGIFLKVCGGEIFAYSA